MTYGCVARLGNPHDVGGAAVSHSAELVGDCLSQDPLHPPRTSHTAASRNPFSSTSSTRLRSCPRLRIRPATVTTL